MPLPDTVNERCDRGEVATKEVMSFELQGEFSIDNVPGSKEQERISNCQCVQERTRMNFQLSMCAGENENEFSINNGQCVRRARKPHVSLEIDITHLVQILRA